MLMPSDGFLEFKEGLFGRCPPNLRINSIGACFMTIGLKQIEDGLVLAFQSLGPFHKVRGHQDGLGEVTTFFLVPEVVRQQTAEEFCFFGDRATIRRMVEDCLLDLADDLLDLAMLLEKSLDAGSCRA